MPATLPPHAGRLPAAVAARGVQQRGREVESAWLRPARRCVATAPWQECGEELAEREQRKAEVCQRKSFARERVQKELAVTRCRAVVVLWRLCTVGNVRLQQGSTMVVPRCSLA